MPAALALYEPTTTISTLTATSAGSGGTIVVSNDTMTAVTWTSWNEEYTSAVSGGAATTLSLTTATGTASAARIWVAWNEQHTELMGSGTTSVTQVTSNADTWVVWNQSYLTGGNGVIQPRISNEEYQARQQRTAEERRLSEERYRA